MNKEQKEILKDKIKEEFKESELAKKFHMLCDTINKTDTGKRYTKEELQKFKEGVTIFGLKFKSEDLEDLLGLDLAPKLPEEKDRNFRIQVLRDLKSIFKDAIDEAIEELDKEVKL
jgi:hypothetical protein